MELFIFIQSNMEKFFHITLDNIISVISIVVSAFVPFLLLKYQEKRNSDTEYANYLESSSVWLSEWLITINRNKLVIEESQSNFRNLANRQIFQKFIDFNLPDVESKRSYNTGFVSEILSIKGKLYGLNLDFHLVDTVYQKIEFDNLNRDYSKLADYGFWIETNINKLEKELLEIEVRIKNLIAITSLLAKEGNQKNISQLRRYFFFWETKNKEIYRKDIKFSESEIEQEIINLNL